MITTTQVQAALPGPTGNVETALINRVEGPLNQRVAVTNREPATGGETVTIPSVTQADRKHAFETLMDQLRLSGYATIVANLAPHEFSAIETAKILKITETNYSHSIGDHADTLTLEMRATVTSTIVNYNHVYQASIHALQNTTPPNMVLLDDTLTYSLSSSISGTESGIVTLTVSATADAISDIDPDAIRRAARWKPIKKASQYLYDNFPITQHPAISISPRWLTRTPWLDWRTSITLAARNTVHTNDNTGR